MASNRCFADSYIQEVIINREKSKRQSRIFFKMLLREWIRFFAFMVSQELVRLL